MRRKKSLNANGNEGKQEGEMMVPWSRRRFVESTMISCMAIAARNGMWASSPDSASTIAPKHVTDPQLRQNLQRIDQVMRTKGIQRDPTSGRTYFTGYSYKSLYDWDSYFEGIVQLELGWTPKYMIEGVKIFLDLQREDGFIRRVNTPGLSEEADEMVKPFLAQISLLISRKLKDTHWLNDAYYQRMRKYLLHWLDGLTKDNGSLSYWRSAPHTGMDTQHERAGHWKADHDNGVDLNSYLYRECLAFALIAGAKKNQADAELFRAKAERKKKAIQKFCWNEKDGLYYDVDNRTGQQIPVKSISGFAPLWARIATEAQAKRLVHEHLTNVHEFWRTFPLSSLAATEKGYTESYLPDDVKGSLWRANTWIPTNYYVFHGLRAYGYKEIASRLADITYQMILRDGDHEYYSSDSAEGRGLDPFWGWTLLAYFMPWENENNLDPTALTLSDPLATAL
jgi:hypothetical protein